MTGPISVSTNARVFGGEDVTSVELCESLIEYPSNLLLSYLKFRSRAKISGIYKKGKKEIKKGKL